MVVEELKGFGYAERMKDEGLKCPPPTGQNFAGYKVDFD
jgi:hypothetical protein